MISDDMENQETRCGENDTIESSDNGVKPPNTEQKISGRKDRGQKHAVRGSFLSRRLLEALTERGENARMLRRLEADCRSELRPKGALGRLFFDRLWQCILRLILLADLEARGLDPRRNASRKPVGTASLREGFLPVLVTEEELENQSAISVAETHDPDLLHQLALIARYDRAASREMFRCLGLLILMRDSGAEGLVSGVRAIAGIKALDGEES